MKNIKAIVTDLDGTFIDDEKVAPSINIETINNLIERGIKFVPASGRDFPSMKDILGDRISDIKYYSCFNGARIFKDGKLIHSVSVPKNLCEIFIEKAQELGAKYSATSGYTVCYTQLDTEYYKEFESENSKYTFHSNEGEEKKILDFEKIVFFGDNKDLEKLEKFVIENYHDDVNIFFSGHGLIDIVSKKCSKGESIKIISKELEIPLENIMAFGDNDNDLPMLEIVGHPVAMINAKDSVKKRIQERSEYSNVCGGVGLYLVSHL